VSRSLALALHEKMLSTIPIFFRSGTEFISEVRIETSTIVITAVLRCLEMWCARANRW
jgi:hypothetical protein